MKMLDALGNPLRLDVEQSEVADDLYHVKTEAREWTDAHEMSRKELAAEQGRVRSLIYFAPMMARLLVKLRYGEALSEPEEADFLWITKLLNDAR